VKRGSPPQHKIDSDIALNRIESITRTAAVGGLLLLATVVPGQQRREEVLVSAASSLSDVLTEASRTFEARDSARIVLNLAASNALVRQVRAGAPVDVFVSADDQQIAQLGDLVRPGSRVELASNQLAVVVPDDRPSRWTSIKGLMDAGVRRVAIGDPAGVPAGVYTKEYLTRAGIWTALQPKLVPTGSVRLALAAVEAGSVDAAIVYRTDAAVAKRSRLAWVVPESEGPRIQYAAVALRDAPNAKGAARFLSFLSSPETAALMRRAGFTPPRPAASLPQ
jgi:molybdate transport system substrate-binding protein